MKKQELHTRLYFLAAWVLLLASAAARQIDVVTPVAKKDAVVYRYCLRHILKHVQHVRNVYVVCRPTPQMHSIAAQANLHFVQAGQAVIIIDEATFPFDFPTMQSFLRQHRPTEGYDGQPFELTVVVPDICEKVFNPKSGKMQPSPKQPKKEWIKKCRQPFANETKAGSGRLSQERVTMSGDGKTEVKVQTFERTGWMLQQLLKLGAGEHIPGILEAYLVVDADTIFYDDYSPIPADDPTGVQYNYMPGDARDCGNPPYFMVTDALRIPPHKKTATICAGRDEKGRRCKTNAQLCPIAHQMVYERAVLRALFRHIEGVASEGSVRGLSWWEAILNTMPAWHTSPFSEYITYFSFAAAHFPGHVRIYDNAQLGATEQEISANYFMGNGLGVTKSCRLVEFAAMKPRDRLTHIDYTCDGGGKGDTCRFYKPEQHGGVPCPAPKYLAYHGFRNNIPDSITRGYHDFDLLWLKEHHQQPTTTATATANATAAAVSASTATTTTTMSATATDAGAPMSPKVAALEEKLLGTHDSHQAHAIEAEIMAIGHNKRAASS